MIVLMMIADRLSILKSFLHQSLSLSRSFLFVDSVSSFALMLGHCEQQQQEQEEMKAQEQPSSADDCDGMIERERERERGSCWLVGGCCSFVVSLLAACCIIVALALHLGLSLYLLSLVYLSFFDSITSCYCYCA